jgi:hypothetical protein
MAEKIRRAGLVLGQLCLYPENGANGVFGA